MATIAYSCGRLETGHVRKQRRIVYMLTKTSHEPADATDWMELKRELRLSHEEAARLVEMIALLGQDLDEGKTLHLRAELAAVRRRAAQLLEELASSE